MTAGNHKSIEIFKENIAIAKYMVMMLNMVTVYKNNDI